MGRAIFISYRRDDTEGEAGRLFDDLIRTFGDNSVFMDVAGINPGMDFRTAIDENVAGCGVLLAVIGPTWSTIANGDGTRRLDDSNDFVRLEIASALARNIAVIPVLVHEARMPRPDQLPDNLKNLAFRNSVEITHARWNSDVQLLIGALRQYVGASEKTSTDTVHATVPVQLPPANPPAHEAEPEKTSRMRLIAGFAVAAVVVIAAVAIFVAHPGNVGNADASNAAQTVTAAPAPAAIVQARTAASGPFAGTWTNSVSTIGNSLNRLTISQAGGALTVHAWGNCTQPECDWGTRTATINGNQASATWTPQKGRVATITVQSSGSRLSVRVDNTYANRASLTKQFNFVRDK